MKSKRKHQCSLSVLLVAVCCILSVVGVILSADPAAAQRLNGCIQDVWMAHGNTQTLNCDTANDVALGKVNNITITHGGECVNGDCTCNAILNPPTNCAENPNQTGCVTFQANYEVLLTAQERYDVGIYFGSDVDANGDGALTGTCLSYVILQNPPMNVPPSVFTNLDGDICGDIQNNTSKTDHTHNPQLLHLSVSVPCRGDQNGGLSGDLKLPYCTSWRTSGQNEVCTGPYDAYPGAPSKCKCNPGFTVPITVLQGELTVAKSASPTSVKEPGGDVEYTVTVTNSGNITVNLTTLTEDDTNNNSVDKTYNSASSPTLASICDTTSLAPGASTDCVFTRTVSGNSGATITDKACVTGTDTNGGTVGPVCSTAAVTIADVPPTATVLKELKGLQCAIVRYHVIVTNTDSAESLVLTNLNDTQFGSITSIQGDVLGTTCGVNTALGTLSNQNGAGGLPATIATNGSYDCLFDAKFCGNSETDTVTASLTDDEQNTIAPTGSVQVCVSASGISAGASCQQQ